jgi:hypothetical protein
MRSPACTTAIDTGYPAPSKLAERRRRWAEWSAGGACAAPTGRTFTVGYRACVRGARIARGRSSTGFRGPPRLLAQDFTAKFAVRPAQIILTGHGATEVIGGKVPSSDSGAATFGRINWTSWTSTQATATVVLWFDHEAGKPPNKYFPLNGDVVASVVRGGPFTRLTIAQAGAVGREITALTRADASGRAGLRYAWD